MAEHLQQSHNGGGGHERTDTGVKIIVYSALGLAVGMVIVCLTVVGIFRGMQKVMPHDARISGIANPNRMPPEPRLQPHPADEYQALRRHEDEVLNHYGWVDQKAGVVRLPIDKAMDILAKRGFPTKSELTAGNANSNSR
jgi:hypothetical protein